MHASRLSLQRKHPSDVSPAAPPPHNTCFVLRFHSNTLLRPAQDDATTAGAILFTKPEHRSNSFRGTQVRVSSGGTSGVFTARARRRHVSFGVVSVDATPSNLCSEGLHNSFIVKTPHTYSTSMLCETFLNVLLYFQAQWRSPPRDGGASSPRGGPSPPRGGTSAPRPQRLPLSPELLSSVRGGRDRFTRFLRRTSTRPVGAFNPWTVVDQSVPVRFAESESRLVSNPGHLG